MAEAARNLESQPGAHNSSPAPNLRSIEGGGETSAPRNPNLKVAGGEKAPIRRGYENARNKADQWGKQGLANANKADELAHKYLRYDVDKDAEAQSVLLPPKAPIYAVGDIIDGTIGNIARRTMDIVSPGAGALRASYRTLTRPFIHPLNTLTHPIKYLSNPVRAVSAGVKTAKNIAMNPFREVRDFGDRAIRRSTQRFGNVPLVGPITGGVAKATSWVLEKPAQAGEWATSWVDEVDAKIAGFQNK